MSRWAGQFRPCRAGLWESGAELSLSRAFMGRSVVAQCAGSCGKLRRPFPESRKGQEIRSSSDRKTPEWCPAASAAGPFLFFRQGFTAGPAERAGRQFGAGETKVQFAERFRDRSSPGRVDLTASACVAACICRERPIISGPSGPPGPCAAVAQLVRAPDCGSGGRRFEPTQLYHSIICKLRPTLRKAEIP